MKNMAIIILCIFTLSCDSDNDSDLKDELIGIWIIKERCKIDCLHPYGECFTSSLSEGVYEYITLDDQGYLEYCYYEEGELDCSLDGNYWTLYGESIELCGIFSDIFCDHNSITFNDMDNEVSISGTGSDDDCEEWSRNLVLERFNNN